MSSDFRELGGRDAYALLGLEQDADAQQIKRAWRAMSRLHHADVGGSDGIQSLLNVAYDTLSDPALRGEYDRYRRTTLLVGSAGPPPPPAREPQAAWKPPPATWEPAPAAWETARPKPSPTKPARARPAPPEPEPAREPDEWDRWDYGDEPEEQRRFESEPEQPRHEAPFNAWSAPRQADPRRDFISTARPVGYDNLAIVSLVLALLFAPAALVTAPMALYRIRRTGAQGRALAITALILVVVLAIALTSGYIIGTRSPTLAD